MYVNLCTFIAAADLFLYNRLILRHIDVANYVCKFMHIYSSAKPFPLQWFDN